MIHVPKAAVILTQSKARFAKFVRWGERKWGEPPSRVSHSILVTDAGDWPAPSLYFEPSIIESDVKVRTGALGTYHAADKLVVWDIEMGDEERDRVVQHALTHEGRPYAGLQLLGQLLDNKLLFGLNVFRRLSKADPLDICSSLVGESLEMVDIRLGPPGYAQSPDDQDDFLRACVAGKKEIKGRKVICLLDEIGQAKG